MFVLGSDEAWLWHCFDLPDALCTWPDHQDISIGIQDGDHGNTLVAVVPLYLQGGLFISSLGGPALANALSRKQRSRIYTFIREHLIALAKRYPIREINLSLSPLAPAYTGKTRPMVNPLLFLGCENTLTQTAIIDLGKDIEGIWQQMEGRARTAIRKAEKSGVQVRKARPDEVDTYYSLHSETYNRTGVPPHPKAYFGKIWSDFLSTSRSLVWFAEHEGTVVAAENFGIFKDRAIYWTGAANQSGLDLEANSLIQWTAIQWMVEHGIQWYETGEAFPNVLEGKLKGLSEFKQSFGGTLFPYYKGSLRMVPQGHHDTSHKDLFKSWLKATKLLLIPTLGMNAVQTIERTLRIAYAGVSTARKRYLRTVHRPVPFIKPFWSKEEVDLGLGIIPVEEQTVFARLSKAFSKTVGSGDGLVIHTGSGRTALSLALKVLKSHYPEKNKVILPSYGCRGTIDPIIENGLTPYFVDITTELLPDPKKMADLFSEDVLACLLVNLTGKKMQSEGLIQRAKGVGIFTIEDNCQNTSRLSDLHHESRPDILMYSFGMGKNLMATAGGALITNVLKDAFVAEAENLTHENIDEGYKRFHLFYHRYIDASYPAPGERAEEVIGNIYGYKRMNPLDAEIVLRQLDRLDTIIARRRQHALQLIEHLTRYPGLFHAQSTDNHIYTKFSIILPDHQTRNTLFSFMAGKGIEIENMYIPLHTRDIGIKGVYEDLSTTEDISSCVVNLPVRPNLSVKELNRIALAIDIFGEKYGT